MVAAATKAQFMRQLLHKLQKFKYIEAQKKEIEFKKKAKKGSPQ